MPCKVPTNTSEAVLGFSILPKDILVQTKGIEPRGPQQDAGSIHEPQPPSYNNNNNDIKLKTENDSWNKRQHLKMQR